MKTYTKSEKWLKELGGLGLPVRDQAAVRDGRWGWPGSGVKYVKRASMCSIELQKLKLEPVGGTYKVANLGLKWSELL